MNPPRLRMDAHRPPPGENIQVGPGRKGKEFLGLGRAHGKAASPRHPQKRMFEDMALPVSHDKIRQVGKRHGRVY